ncbi:mitochondrial amidoxime reducing component 2-like [Penaeus japonicus]|uniref:mitochondrial amidoxime reducing component 2-like n=1 Tax=Penaeus japonicus TaxID=27405 RepID=UPI001C71745D|nr:mitochondrial amidoxime reducing component 2-like [Penaeus japonicus]
MYYADTCAYLVTTTSSLLDLNTRSKEPVQMTCFRPNLVVQSATPFDEDDWAFLKIGEVILRRLKPCERCIQTTINMNSGLRHPAGEPITTLKTYRVPKEPEKLAKLWKNKPTFGVNMAIESTGSLHTGDVVYVARISTHPWFRST